VHVLRGLRRRAALAFLPLVTCAYAQGVTEQQLKAAFVYNFAKFVEWPAESFRRPTDPVVSCVLGDSAIQGALADAGRTAPIGERNFVVRRVLDAEQARECHILFVSAAERKRWRGLLPDIRGGGVLAVGESDSFLSEGGVVNLRLDGGRIRIQIDVTAVERERLRISSRLLSLAEIVGR
jgi:hypothetical protein